MIWFRIIAAAGLLGIGAALQWTPSVLVAEGADAQTTASVERTERGPVSATVSVEPTQPRIGDAVTLTLEVVAEAGVELLMPEFGAALDRFRILEFTPRETIDSEGRTVSVQRYRLLMPASGSHTIPPITVEFVDRRPGQRPAPEDEDAFELLTESLGVEVQSVLPENAGDALKPPLEALPVLEAETSRAWLGLGLAALAAGLGAVILLWRLRRRPGRVSAYHQALGRLNALNARQRPGAENMDAFFVELTDIVRRYLEDRFGLHAPELTTEEFLDVAAGSPDLTSDHRGFLREFLGKADRVKFARHVPAAEEVTGLLDAVRAFLEQTAQTSEVAGSPPPGATVRADV